MLPSLKKEKNKKTKKKKQKKNKQNQPNKQQQVGTKLSPLDNKEISTSLKFRLDKLTTFLLTK